MRLAFSKMQGLGNDFVVINAMDQAFVPSPELCRRLADRRFGIGCDQVLLVEAPGRPDLDFNYRIFNADGSEVEQCGNGARCFARFVREHGLSSKDELRVGTAAGEIHLYHAAKDWVRVNMGMPQLEPAMIPFVAPARALRYDLKVVDESLAIGAVSMGNPHAVLRVADVAKAPVARLGPLIECHPRFPKKVNVGFLAVESPTRCRLRVHERGVGETLACGTGACAAVVAGRLWGELADAVEVVLPGGPLRIQWSGEGHPVWMTGPAVHVFEGVIEL